MKTLKLPGPSSGFRTLAKNGLIQSWTQLHLASLANFDVPIFSKCSYSTWHDIYRKLKCNFISSSVAIDRPWVGAVGTRAPLSPISFIFMQFLAKIWPNNWFLLHTQGWHPRLENPGSATGYLIAITLNFKVAQTN